MQVAVVGCGSIVGMHLDALAGISDVKIVACCDIKRDRAETAAEPYGANIYTDFEEMMSAEKIDVLHICTPHYLHVPMAKRAAKDNVAVFTEKPPAISWEQWEELKEVGKKVPVGVCFQNRYNPDNIVFSELVKSPKAGKLLGGKAIVTWSRDAAYYTESGWRGQVKTEGGSALINQAIHTLDLLVRCLGVPEAVEAHSANFHLKDINDAEDSMNAYISFENGSKGLLWATTAYCDDAPVTLEVICENLTAHIESGTITCRWADGTVEKITPQVLEVSGKGKSYWGASHIACISDFYDSLREKREFKNNLESCENTMRATLGIYQSSRESKSFYYK